MSGMQEWLMELVNADSFLIFDSIEKIEIETVTGIYGDHSYYLES